MPTDSNTYPKWLYDWDLPESTDYVNVTYLPNEAIITFTEKFINDLHYDLHNEIRPHKRLKSGDP